MTDMRRTSWPSAFEKLLRENCHHQRQLSEIPMRPVMDEWHAASFINNLSLTCWLAPNTEVRPEFPPKQTITREMCRSLGKSRARSISVLSDGFSACVTNTWVCHSLTCPSRNTNVEHPSTVPCFVRKILYGCILRVEGVYVCVRYGMRSYVIGFFYHMYWWIFIKESTWVSIDVPQSVHVWLYFGSISYSP